VANKYELFSCQNCGTLYTATVPRLEENYDYDSYYRPEKLVIPEFLERRLDEIVTAFLPYRQNGRLLDVGFGAGSLLQAAGRAGWQSHGIEVSQRAVEHLRNQGFEVQQGTLEEAAYPDNHFDVVTAVEVIEHVPEPRLLLQEIARILRPGGLFWATTPHCHGLSARLLGMRWSTICPPEHLQLFSVRGAGMLCRGAGFQRVGVATQGTNPYEIAQMVRQKIRPRAQSGTGANVITGGERVASSYQLNAYMTQNPARRLVKNGVNGLLNVTRLGDSLKISAVL
jgi:SAM-dependent methyltransferase